MIHIVDKISSTNTWLPVYFSEEGDTILSMKQSKGRGRRGNLWDSDKGGAYFSTISRNHHLLPFITGICIAETLNAFCDNLKLKWPNDLLLNGKKIGGILCESKVKKNLLNQIVIGIGLNVNETKEDFDPAIQSMANSLHIVSGKFYQRERVLAEIANELEPWISGLPKNIDQIQFEWEAACGHLKEEIQFHNGNEIVSGIFKSLGKSGSAVIEVDGKETQFHSGEIN